MRTQALFLSWLCLCLSTTSAAADTLRVGSGKPFAAPCAAIAAAQDGDTIEIDAGTYAGDVCGWTKSGLTLRGVGGRPKIDAAGQNAQGKGTWVIGGNDTTVDNVELMGAEVPDLNGAGIRADGKNLTIRNCYFHDNQDGILGGAGAVLIEFSEFARNGNCIDPSGCAHNMYIDHADTFTLRGSYSHSATDGHLVKSRAAVNYILYNRLTGEDGTQSYEIDLPNGGTSYVIGNLLQQGPSTGNPTFIAYREEGGNAKNPGTDLYVVNNTFVNDKGSGTFIDASTPTPVVIVNNAFLGGGTITGQATALKTTNYAGTDAMLADVAGFDVRPLAGSPLVDNGSPPGMGAGFSLVPALAYSHPLAVVSRAAIGTIDIGAHELGGEAPPPVTDLGTVDGATQAVPDGGMPATAMQGGCSLSGGRGLGSAQLLCIAWCLLASTRRRQRAG